MILVILGVCIALCVLGAVLEMNTHHETTAGICYVSGFLGAVVSLITAIVLICVVSNLSTIDDRIAMYQEENTRIETQIAETVQQYQKYESDIFTEVKPEYAMTMVALYPELKSDKLVEAQINVYVENNELIKELKAEKIRGRVARWWLYFGS